MLIHQLHSWDVDIEQARSIQLELQKRIVLCPLKRSVKLIAGADVSYSLKERQFFAGVVILQYPDLTEVESSVARGNISFPYVPGFLTFREAPVLLKAFEKITAKPDVIMFDGQGIAHPRKLGIATHLGIILNIAAVGCAKSKLVGNYDFSLPENRGAVRYLSFNGEKVGAVVRTKTSIKPLFISPGYKITIDESIELVLKTTSKYRLPEPTRQAHILVNRIRKNKMSP